MEQSSFGLAQFLELFGVSSHRSVKRTSFI